MLKVLSMLSTVIQRPWSLFYILDITILSIYSFIKLSLKMLNWIYV